MFAPPISCPRRSNQCEQESNAAVPPNCTSRTPRSRYNLHSFVKHDHESHERSTHGDDTSEAHSHDSSRHHKKSFSMFKSFFHRHHGHHSTHSHKDHGSRVASPTPTSTTEHCLHFHPSTEMSSGHGSPVSSPRHSNTGDNHHSGSSKKLSRNQSLHSLSSLLHALSPTSKSLRKTHSHTHNSFEPEVDK
jgi:hypothetical protein